MYKIGKLLLDGCNYCEDFEWEDVLAELDIIMSNKNKDVYWYCEVENFGWRKLSGNKHFIANTSSEFLNAILPETECNFEIYNYGKGLCITNKHHDSPLGDEKYYIIPIAQKTYENRSGKMKRGA